MKLHKTQITFSQFSDSPSTLQAPGQTLLNHFKQRSVERILKREELPSAKCSEKIKEKMLLDVWTYVSRCISKYIYFYV